MAGFRPGFPLVEAKLRPPAPRPGTIGRDRLVRRLTAEPRLPVATLTAPPGYGKTRVLAELAARDTRPVAWLSLDDFDNDGSVFLTYLAAALDRIEPISHATGVAVRRGTQRVPASGVPRLVAELHGWREPATLVLDDVHRLADPGCLEALAVFIDHLPAGFQVILAGRTAVDLPLARLFATRCLLELDRRDLALDVPEVLELAQAAGRPISPDQAARLVAATEGWAAGVYLSLMAGRDGVDALASGPGSPDHVAQYVRRELLGSLDDERLRLLRWTSILEVVEPGVADAIVAAPGSAGLLDALATGNGLMTRTTGPEVSYRCHALLREVLRDDLLMDDSAMIPELHRRAAAWYGSVGRAELGIEHALAAGDSDQAAALFAASVMRTYLGGHPDLIGRWLREIGEATFERNPGPAMIASLVYAMFGMPVESEHLARIAERSPAVAAADAPMWHMVKSMLARDGSLQAHADARAGVEGEPEWGTWRMLGLYCLAASSIMVGDATAADLHAATAVEAAGSGVGTAPFFGLALRSSLAVERGDWASAAMFARRSHDEYDRTGLGDVVTAILVHAVSARVAIHAGDLERARQELVHAQVARVTASRASAAASVLAQLEIARAYLALADAAGARQVMSEAAAILRSRPDLGLIGARVGALRSSLEQAPHVLAGASTLTAAELRVLPALSTPLSFREIGERLFLSPHTIKTHAMSIYGKLDASSRSEAVERAIELGLLDPFPRVPARRHADGA